MTNLSPATGLAWQAAASEALQHGASWIEPDHLLIGISSVGKLLQQTGFGQQHFSAHDRNQIQRESDVLAQAMAEVGIDVQVLRRTLRAKGTVEASPGQMPASTKMRRSIASQEVFARAEALASADNSNQLELAHLGAALLELPVEKIDAVFETLGKQKVDLRLALLRKITAKGRVEGGVLPEEESSLEIAHTIDAGESSCPFVSGTSNSEIRSALLYELPLLFGSGGRITDLLQQTMHRIQRVIPAASHASLLTKDRVTNELLLLAHVPAGVPQVSQTLARQVMDSRKACIWIRGQQEPTASLNAYGIHSGIYAPLLWQNEVLGVFLLSSQDPRAVLRQDDLRLIVALAHHAAMALAGAQLQNDLRRKGELLERMLTNFSPRIRDALLDRASRGILRLGGEKSEVTILCSDVRGFTKTSEKLTTDEVVDLLNDYFSGLVDAIFRYDGTIDKFLGDGILAVFGSPERDRSQHLKALRAAIAMQEAMKKSNEARSARGLLTCEIGIGVHCGEVFHGFIGTADRMEFTVIGDAVNRTARYCAGAAGGEILISPQLFQHTWKLAVVEPTRIGTKHEGEFETYRVTGLKA